MNRDALLGISNELTADGWCRIAPYGDSIKAINRKNATGGVDAVTYIQRLDQKAAQALANGFNSLWGKLKRAIASVPLFNGHPDLARLSPSTDAAPGDEVPVGTLNRLEARDDGLYAQVGLFPAGQALANEGRKFISPFWWTEPIETRGETIIVRPVEIISGGLTDRPNIPGGEPLANQGTPGAQSQNAPEKQQTEDKEMKQLLIGLLAARGVPLANDAGEDAILAKVTEAIKSADGARDEAVKAKDALANEKTALATERDMLKASVEAVTTERDSARSALANERKGRAEALVDLAIAQGKVAVADRGARVTKLAGAGDFDAEAKALANEEVKHSTTSNQMGTRRQSSAPAGSVHDRIAALANSAEFASIQDYNKRFDAILAAHPEIAAELKPKA